MPLTAALLASIAAIAGGATAAGTGIYSATQAGGGGQPAAPPPPTAAANVAAEVAKRGQDAQIVRRQEPGLVSATGGGLSDQAYQTGASQNAGMPGAFGAGGFDMNSILQLLSGQQSGGSSGSTNLMDLASGSTGGSIT
jgi:hypothetical protein